MQIKKRGRIYYLHYWCSENKYTKKVSLGTSSREEAQQEAAYFIANIKDRDFGDMLTVREVIDFYIRDNLEADPKISQRNREIYAGRVRYVSSVLGDVAAETLDQSHINRFCKVKDNVTSGTQRTYLAQMLAALNHAKRKGRIKNVPDLKLPEHNPPAQRWLNESEIEKIRQAGRSMRNNPLKPCRAEVFFEIALYTGQRKTAITSLTWDRVDLEKKLIDFRYRKVQTTKRSGMVPMHPKLHEFLTRLLPFKTNAYVCYNDGDIRTTFDTMINKSRVERATPKTMRHTTASIMMSNSVSAEIIAKIIGNTPQMVIKVYGHLDPKAVAGAMSAMDHL